MSPMTRSQHRQEAATKVLGIVTTYHGNDHPYLRGHKVRIIAVFKNAARPDYDADAEDGYLNDDDAIAHVTADDRVEVQPWIEKECRFSFASSDPRATDLECFAHLAR